MEVQHSVYTDLGRDLSGITDTGKGERVTGGPDYKSKRWGPLRYVSMTPHNRGQRPGGNPACTSIPNILHAQRQTNNKRRAELG